MKKNKILKKIVTAVFMRGKRYLNHFNRGFTLAEVIAVVTVLGIVATITIPITLKKTTERQNKTKVAKAIATYNKLIQTFTLENSLNVSTTTLDEIARYNKYTLPQEPKWSSFRDNPVYANYSEAHDAYIEADEERENLINSGECENIRKYFNVQDYSFRHKETNKNVTMPTKCMFKSGGLWWDVTNITTTIIAPNPEVLVVVDKNSNKVEKNPDISSIASDYDDNRAFYLTTSKNKNGSYMTNYIMSSTSLDEQIKKVKAHDYAFNKQSVEFLTCKGKRTTNCVEFSQDYKKSTFMAYKDANGNISKFYSNCSYNNPESCACKYKAGPFTDEYYHASFELENADECVEYAKNNINKAVTSTGSFKASSGQTQKIYVCKKISNAIYGKYSYDKSLQLSSRICGGYDGIEVYSYVVE